MRPLRIAVIAAIPLTLAAQTPVPTVEQTLVEREKQSWAAWQNKDLDFWRRHLSADHVELDGPDGPQDRNYVLSGIAKRTCSVASHEVDNFTFRRLAPDAAMLVYHASQLFACGDKRIPNVGWVTSVYRRRGGKWENVLFQHMEVPPPKPPAPPKPN